MNLDLPEAVLTAIRDANRHASAGDPEAAEAAYQKLLQIVGDDDYQAAAVLHMYAVVVQDPERKIHLNLDALDHAESAENFPPALFASLYGNIGYSYLEAGDHAQARVWYGKAEAAASGLDDDDYGRMVRDGISSNLAALLDGAGDAP